jgi:ABC-type microcin C transport system duplicated ATPase subunit YejF
VLRPEILSSKADLGARFSVQQVLALLVDLQRRYGMATSSSARHLAVVRAVSHRVMVMKDGLIVEEGGQKRCSRRPASPIRRPCRAAHLA